MVIIICGLSSFISTVWAHIIDRQSIKHETKFINKQPKAKIQNQGLEMPYSRFDRTIYESKSKMFPITYWRYIPN